MSNFDFLGSEQTLFSNPDALDPDFVPKMLPHREEQQKFIATAIKPLFHERTGLSIIITGAAGIGKTVSVKRVLMDLEEVEEAGNISKIFINCWKANTTYKIMTEIAHQLGFKFTHNLKTNEVIDKVIEILSKKDGAVIVLDEADKSEEQDFIYHILENIKKRTIFLITNERSFSSQLDHRILSRLSPESLHFKEYSVNETTDILKERIKYAFYQDVWNEEAFQLISKKASEFKDIRVGITLLKLAGEIAETDSSKKITPEHAKQAIERISEFKIKSSNDFKSEELFVMEICKKHSGKTTGELFKIYFARGGKKSEKTFKRTLDTLVRKRIITMKPTGEGFQGRSSIIEFRPPEKKLTEF
tara:strand:+ start:1483 stop:2562 length:1080 start_codon:yes stop_codon:yes gene_type:complete